MARCSLHDDLFAQENALPNHTRRLPGPACCSFSFSPRSSLLLGKYDALAGLLCCCIEADRPRGKLFL